MPLQHPTDHLKNCFISLKRQETKKGHFNVTLERKTWYNLVLFPNVFQHFPSLRTFCFMLEPKILFQDVYLYALNAHDLKCNVNPLTPGQIIFCLADTENHKFKDPRTCLLLYPPQTVFVGGYTVFTLSESPTDRVSETFCFFNNFKNH